MYCCQFNCTNFYLEVQVNGCCCLISDDDVQCSCTSTAGLIFKIYPRMKEDGPAINTSHMTQYIEKKDVKI